MIYTKNTAETAAVKTANFHPISYTEKCPPIIAWLTDSSTITGSYQAVKLNNCNQNASLCAAAEGR